MHLLLPVSTCVNGQHTDRATRNSRPHTIGTASEDDWYSCPKYKSCAIGIGQEAQLFCEDISGFKIGRHKNVRIASNLRMNVFGFCGVSAACVVERQGAVEDCARNLSS